MTVTLHWTHNRLAGPCWVSHYGHSPLDTQPIGRSLLGIPRQSLFTGHSTNWSVLAGYHTTVTLHWKHNQLVSSCWVSHDSHSSLDTQPIGQSLLGITRQSLFTGHSTNWSVLAGYHTTVTLHWKYNRLESADGLRHRDICEDTQTTIL